jgi:hypothetical protein
MPKYEDTTVSDAMGTNAFVGSATQPSDVELSAVLGVKRALWDELLEKLRALGVDGREWSSYSHKSGWALKVLQKKRVIVYLSPLKGGFRASFALGDRAVEQALASKLPARVIKVIREARRYAEGTAVRLEVNSHADVAAVLKLATIKMEN